MKRTHRDLVGSVLSLMVMMTATCIADEPKDLPPGSEPKSTGTFDSALQSIKRGAQDASEAIRDQYNRAKTSIHNMGVASRVYGRLHWDKVLNGSQIDIDVQNDGVATLTGVVADAHAKIKAVDLTRDTVGVTQVVDQLTIQPAPTSVPATTTTPSGSTAEKP